METSDEEGELDSVIHKKMKTCNFRETKDYSEEEHFKFNVSIKQNYMDLNGTDFLRTCVLCLFVLVLLTFGVFMFADLSAFHFNSVLTLKLTYAATKQSVFGVMCFNGVTQLRISDKLNFNETAVRSFVKSCPEEMIKTYTETTRVC